MINSFRGEYFFLSNFYPCKVLYRGVEFGSSESAYQAAKCKNDDDFILFVGTTAKEAKKLGRHVDLIHNWDERKVFIMREVLEVKFSDEELAALLMRTYGKDLVEWNTWGDTFWGVCDGVGKNMLGLELMRIRNKLRQSHIDKALHLCYSKL